MNPMSSSAVTVAKPPWNSIVAAATWVPSGPLICAVRVSVGPAAAGAPAGAPLPAECAMKGAMNDAYSR